MFKVTFTIDLQSKCIAYTLRPNDCILLAFKQQLVISLDLGRLESDRDFLLVGLEAFGLWKFFALRVQCMVSHLCVADAATDLGVVCDFELPRATNSTDEVFGNGLMVARVVALVVLV